MSVYFSFNFLFSSSLRIQVSELFQSNNSLLTRIKHLENETQQNENKLQTMTKQKDQQIKIMQVTNGSYNVSAS